MTLDHGIRIDSTDAAPAGGVRQIHRVDVPMSSRVWARLFAARYDQQVEAGVTVAAGSPLAAHYLRVTCLAERKDIAGALVLLLRDAGLVWDAAGSSTRVPIHVDAVRRSADIVEEVLARLASPVPVRARGMARLRILLSDGRGPVYRSGRGTFAAAMRGVLAAM